MAKEKEQEQTTKTIKVQNNNKKVVSYNKWGIIFLLPFVIVYLVFQLIPLVSTIVYSFFEYYDDGLDMVGPNFKAFGNYIKLFANKDLFVYAGNTLIMCFMAQPL